MTEVPASGVVERQVGVRLLSAGFDRWASQAASTGHCARPVRLRGSALTLDRATGEVLSRYDSRVEPDGVLYKRCGNRRASVCPSCSHEYQGDMWHLLAAGAAGGMKGVPASITGRPLVFATLTAPSFGPVHTSRTARDGRPGRCSPRGAASRARCPHGRLVGCVAAHGEGDRRLGQPLCPDCYDYRGHVVWQWSAPELWRRFTIALTRALAARLGLTVADLGRRCRVSFAKVAEFQRRAVVHFHALIRLDGPAGAVTDDDPYPAPTVDITAGDLVELVCATAARVSYDAPATEPGDVVRRLGFGVQVDARPVDLGVDRETGRGDTDGGLHPQTVAAYIAKYATKACDDFGLPPRVRDPGAARRAGVSKHVCRVLAEVHALAAAGVAQYAMATRWVCMLGFRGHFATKSRRYSTTLGRLRTARRRWQLRRLRAEQNTALRRTAPDTGDGWDLNDDGGDDSTLVVGAWEWAGIGWLTVGDAALVAHAAEQVRAHRDDQRQRRPHPVPTRDGVLPSNRRLPDRAGAVNGRACSVTQ